MHSCLNCGGDTGDKLYCGACGQRTIPVRLRLRDLAQNINEQLLEWHLPWPRTLVDVAVRPGQTARAYVDGKRARYVNPLKYAFYLLVIATLVGGHPFGEMHLPDDFPVWRRVLVENLPLFALVMSPVSVVIHRLAFWRAGLNLSEISVFVLYMLGNLTLLLVLASKFAAPLVNSIAGFGSLLVALAVYGIYAEVGFFRSRLDHALVAGAAALIGWSWVAGATYMWLLGNG